jgi:hypothetical protein
MILFTAHGEDQAVKRQEQPVTKSAAVRDERFVRKEQPGQEPSKSKPFVEAYDPHFGSHLMRKSSFWRI